MNNFDVESFMLFVCFFKLFWNFIATLSTDCFQKSSRCRTKCLHKQFWWFIYKLSYQNQAIGNCSIVRMLNFWYEIEVNHRLLRFEMKYSKFDLFLNFSTGIKFHSKYKTIFLSVAKQLAEIYRFL